MIRMTNDLRTNLEPEAITLGFFDLVINEASGVGGMTQIKSSFCFIFFYPVKQKVRTMFLDHVGIISDNLEVY